MRANGIFFPPSNDPAPFRRWNLPACDCRLRERKATQSYWNSRSGIRGHNDTRLQTKESHPPGGARHVTRGRFGVDDFLRSGSFLEYVSATSTGYAGGAGEASKG